MLSFVVFRLETECQIWSQFRLKCFARITFKFKLYKYVRLRSFSSILSFPGDTRLPSTCNLFPTSVCLYFCRGKLSLLKLKPLPQRT